MKNQARGCLHIIAYPIVLWIGVTLIGCVQRVSPLPPSPGPDDGGQVQPVEPKPLAIDEASEQGIKDYAIRSAEVFEALAVDIESGKFASQAAMADEMDERTKAARFLAFEAMRAAWWAGTGEDTGNPTAEWDRAADAAKCRETAKGFRRAVAK